MFGCSEGGRSLWHLRDEVMERAFDEDRLTRREEVDRERLGLFLETRRLTRRDALRAGGALALATAAAPAFADLASAHPSPSAPVGRASARPTGAEHVIPSVAETVHLGQLDSTLPPIYTIESGDTLVDPNTMSRFLNRFHPASRSKRSRSSGGTTPAAVPIRSSVRSRSGMPSRATCSPAASTASCQ